VDDETGRVGVQGPNDAIDNWPNDAIDANILQDAIDAWRSGDLVLEDPLYCKLFSTETISPYERASDRRSVNLDSIVLIQFAVPVYR